MALSGKLCNSFPLENTPTATRGAVDFSSYLLVLDVAGSLPRLRAAFGVPLDVTDAAQLAVQLAVLVALVTAARPALDITARLSVGGFDTDNAIGAGARHLGFDDGLPRVPFAAARGGIAGLGGGGVILTTDHKRHEEEQREARMMTG